MAADLVGDRWTLLILREALYGVQRYDDLRADLQAPRSVLTQRLKRLVEHGIMMRQPYRDSGSRTRQAYVLTKVGRQLALPLLALMQWGDDHIRSDAVPISICDSQTGKVLKVALVTEDADSVPLERVQFKVKRD